MQALKTKIKIIANKIGVNLGFELLMTFNVENIRKDFPILERKINGKTLIYFDNAATSQTPTSVIDSISDYYKI